MVAAIIDAVAFLCSWVSSRRRRRPPRLYVIRGGLDRSSRAA
jgi:hypothetical protein